MLNLEIHYLKRRRQGWEDVVVIQRYCGLPSFSPSKIACSRSLWKVNKEIDRDIKIWYRELGVGSRESVMKAGVNLQSLFLPRLPSYGVCAASICRFLIKWVHRL